MQSLNYIEFIGPQGAGKTTLLKKLIENREKNDSWCTYDEAIIEIANGLRWKDLRKSRQQMLWLMRKADLFNKKLNGLSIELVKSLRDKQDRTDLMIKFEFLIEAHIKAVAEMDMDISPDNLFNLMTWHYRSLKRFALLEEFRFFNKTVIMDEGPFKTHYGLQYIDPKKVNQDCLPMAIVYCRLDKEENIRRIMQRYSKTGRLSRIHNKYNNDNIEKVTSKLHDILTKNLHILQSMNIPILNLDMGTEVDTDQVMNFIRNTVTVNEE